MPGWAWLGAPSVRNRESRRQQLRTGGGALSSMPGDGDLLALTLDDGVNSDVVRLYTQFAKDTGIRLTYFVNGRYRRGQP